jgi:hypothetical protein
MLERLGGSIDIKSSKEKNLGVEFYIKFPTLKD